MFCSMVNMWVSSFLLIVFVFSVDAEDNNCITPENKFGKCILQDDCVILHECLTNDHKTKKQKDFLSKSMCGDDLICCPNKYPKKLKCKKQKENGPPSEAEIAAKEFPWIALLIFKDDSDTEKIVCAGSLISERYVLTAAYCMNDYDHKILTVRFGDYDIDNSGIDHIHLNVYAERVIDAKIENIRYSEPDDITLIRLNMDIPFSDYVNRIYLPKESDAPRTDEWLTVAGWGTQSPQGPANVKTKADIRVRVLNQCNDAKNKPKHVLCVDGDSTEEFCNGEIGSPLMVEAPTGISKKIIVGMVSSQQLQCLSDKSRLLPRAFIDITKYVKWINEIISQA